MRTRRRLRPAVPSSHPNGRSLPRHPPIMAEVPDAGTSAMDVDANAYAVGDKITLLPGYAPDFSAATFCLTEEDHTLGNSLRWMLMKDPEVEFCGYSIPHPSEAKIHLRIQMYDAVSVFPALRRALTQLTEVFTTIGDQYQEAMDAGEYERYEEKTLDKEWLQKFKEEGQKRRAEEAAAAAQKVKAANGK